MSQRKLRVGMVGGGGPANFFGAPHRRAILMDNSAELTAGALRTKPDESIASATRTVHATRLSRLADHDQDRSLPSRESERIDYVTIVTPNDAHFGPADARRGRGDRRALRKAADDHARRSPPPAGQRSRQERPVRGCLHVHRLPDGDAGSRTRSRTARSARFARSRRGTRRDGWPPSSRPKTRSKLRGGSIPPRRAVRDAEATSAPMRMSSSGSPPGCRPFGCVPA